MNAKRLTLLTAAGLALSGCGITATVLGSGTHSTPSAASPLHTTAATTQPAPPTSAAPTAAPTPPPPPPPQVIVTAAENGASGATFTVALVNTAGTLLASTAVPNDARWTVGAGSGAAYWVTAGKLRKLDTHGAVTTLAAVPTTESGRVVVSPDGSEWAYATMSSGPGNVIINRLYRGGITEPARLIAQRTVDPAHPSADAPDMWQYYLDSWTARGILVERQPVGGCGCGTPFDMEMSAGFSAFINPLTGAPTPVTASTACPLSGVAADGTAACFHSSASGGSDRIEFVAGLHTTAQYSLSGKSLGGDSIFNGSTVAYATVPSTAGGCGAADWAPQTTLHLMDVRTGSAVIVGHTGLAPKAWLNNGSILATFSVAGQRGGPTTSSVVEVDASTGQTTTLLDRTTVIVGLA